MKTSILVTGGGVMSKSILVNEIATYASAIVNLNFGNTEIRFNTKREAVRALNDAYKVLKSDREDWEASLGSYCEGSSLSYDAGNARIVTSN